MSAGQHQLKKQADLGSKLPEVHVDNESCNIRFTDFSLARVLYFEEVLA